MRIAPDAVVRLLTPRKSSDSLRDGPPAAAVAASERLKSDAELVKFDAVFAKFDAELVGASKSGIKLKTIKKTTNTILKANAIWGNLIVKCYL